MTSLEQDLALIGDQLQEAWRADAHQARRHHALLAAALVTLLAITGAAIASDIFPIRLTKTDTKPPAAALRDLRATYRPAGPLKPWQQDLDLDLTKAITIANVTSRETGPLAIIVVPVKRGVCVDAARPDGSSYLSGCAQQPTRQQADAMTRLLDRLGVAGGGVAPPDSSRGFYTTVEARKRNGVTQPPLGLWILNAPPHAARIDVRRRDASQLPAVISHGWLVFLNPHPGGAAVLVRVYDKSGKRLVSYYT
jgi:hypothetical protein